MHDLRVHELDGRRHQAIAHNLAYGVGGIAHLVKAGDRRHDAFWQSAQPQRDLGGDRQRPLRADEQADQIVAARAFQGIAAQVQDFAGGQHNIQLEHIVASQAIFHRAHATGAIRYHSAKRGHVRAARRRREKEALRAQLSVQLVIHDARLDAHLQILRAHLQNAIPFVHGEDDAATGGDGVALQAGAAAPGHHRHAMLGGPPQHGADLLGALRPDDDLWQVRWVPRLVPGVRLQIGLFDRDALWGGNGLQVLDVLWLNHVGCSKEMISGLVPK
jgi:hypothetical protein